MEQAEFDIVIDKGGKVTVEVKGIKGPRCLDYADLIREIVGFEEDRKLTVEYYAPNSKVRIDAKTHERLGG